MSFTTLVIIWMLLIIAGHINRFCDSNLNEYQTSIFPGIQNAFWREFFNTQKTFFVNGDPKQGYQKWWYFFIIPNAWHIAKALWLACLFAGYDVTFKYPMNTSSLLWYHWFGISLSFGIAWGIGFAFNPYRKKTI